MTIHELKIKKDYFIAIRNRTKNFELRKNDRDYRVGDLIKFIVLDDFNITYNPSELYYISYVLQNCPEYGLQEGYCILAIKEVRIDD